MMIRRTLMVSILLILLLFLVSPWLPLRVGAAEFQLPDISLNINGSSAAEGEGLVMSLQILLLLTVLSLAPAILIMMTSFTRIIIVLSLIRNALATQRMPPNQVLIGLAIFLTIFIMAPVWQEVYTDAVLPYTAGELALEDAYDQAIEPVRDFMLRQTREKDIALFIEMAGTARPENRSRVSLYTLIPAFVISELKNAFQIGFMIYLPFLMIDMVVASILMSMGMLMLPPVMISLPFKLLLFILIDGWYLVIQTLVRTFN